MRVVKADDSMMFKTNECLDLSELECKQFGAAIQSYIEERIDSARVNGVLASYNKTIFVLEVEDDDKGLDAKAMSAALAKQITVYVMSQGLKNKVNVTKYKDAAVSMMDELGVRDTVPDFTPKQLDIASDLLAQEAVSKGMSDLISNEPVEDSKEIQDDVDLL